MATTETRETTSTKRTYTKLTMPRLKLEEGDSFEGTLVAVKDDTFIDKLTGEEKPYQRLIMKDFLGERFSVALDAGLRQQLTEHKLLNDGSRFMAQKGSKVLLDGGHSVNQWEVFLIQD